MLSTVVTVTSTSSSTSALSSAISMTTAVSIGVGGALIAIFLILFLASKELISVSSLRTRKILDSLNTAILPLLVVFALTVVFKVMEVLSV